MTSERQKRKHGCILAVVPAFIWLGALAFAAVPAARAGITQRIVVDWRTGLAISGYDPVAFFTDGKPMTGSADVEYNYGGAVWRFLNVGNRDAFASHPDIYMPQFGGYDPVDVARGVAVAGNPDLWTIAGERLYLFYDGAKRQEFIADPARFIASAERKWPDLKETLDP